MVSHLSVVPQVSRWPCRARRRQPGCAAEQKGAACACASRLFVRTAKAPAAPAGTVLGRDEDNKARLEQLRRWCSACGGREVPSNRIAGVKVHFGELINVVPRGWRSGMCEGEHHSQA